MYRNRIITNIILYVYICSMIIVKEKLSFQERANGFLELFKLTMCQHITYYYKVYYVYINVIWLTENNNQVTMKQK